MADDAQSAADSSAYQQVGTRNPVGCASLSNIVENTADSPFAGPFSDDCYTTLLHSSPARRGLSSDNHSGKRSADCYTNLPHNVRTHLLVRRGGRFYYRRRVPRLITG